MHQNFIKFGIGVLYRKLSGTREISESRFINSYTLLRATMNFYKSFSYFMANLG